MERSESILSIKTKEHFFTAPVVIVALLLGAVAFWGADKQTLGLFHDDGIYAVVAKALAQGDGYRVVSLPGAPAQTKYPFLFSFLISLLWRFAPSFPENIALLKSLNIVILVMIFLVFLSSAWAVCSLRGFSGFGLMLRHRLIRCLRITRVTISLAGNRRR